MERWGYVTVKPKPGGRRSPPRSQWIIRATPAGRKAQEIWRPLFDEIERRWQDRFGKGEIDALRKSLWDLVNRFEMQLPDCLPMLGYGLFNDNLSTQNAHRSGQPGNEDGSRLPLSALLSKALLMFAIECERDSKISLAICANLLRLVKDEGIRVRELPNLATVSREAIAASAKFLEKSGYAAVQPESPGSRTKSLVLTAKGRRARNAYERLLWIIEDHWSVRYSADAVRGLRRRVEALEGEPAGRESRLLAGLDPYPDCWRASPQSPQGCHTTRWSCAVVGSRNGS